MTRDEVETFRADYPYDGFTSSDAARLLGARNNADRLIERAAAAALGDGKGRRDALDLVVILDDVELCNAHQVDAVVGVVREAVARHLERVEARGGDVARTRRVLRERVSFHLAMPMIEAWLFADASALARAGVSSQRPARWADRCDPEAFETDDPEYDADDGSACASWAAERSAKRKQKNTPLWLKASPRQRHPKAYLAWLCCDPKRKTCSSYRESHEGAAALRGLAWERLLGEPGHCQYARAMLEDIAWALGVELRDVWRGECDVETTLARDAREFVLRNL